MEYTVIKCIHQNKYDELLKMFDFDTNKSISEVEKFLGRKLSKPGQDNAVATQ